MVSVLLPQQSKVVQKNLSNKIASVHTYIEVIMKSCFQEINDSLPETTQDSENCWLQKTNSDFPTNHEPNLSYTVDVLKNKL